MKNLKNYALLITALFLISTVGYSQIVLASNKDKNKKKKDKETTEVAEPASTTETTEAPPQEEKPEEKTFTLSGSVDTYFHSTLGLQNAYYNTSFGDAYAPSTSFADLKGFSLGMANLIFAYQGEKSGFVADLVFGPRGQAAVFGTASGQAIINQMYAYRKFTDGFTLNLGQFNTFVGYEVISPAVNFHYSTSYLFSWGPFNHTGIRADFSFGDGFVAKAAIMNPTDIVEFNPVNTVTLGGQFGYTNDNGGVWLNILVGDQDGKLDAAVDANGTFSAGTLFQWDVTTGWNLGEKFYLGFNASMQSVGEGKVVSGNDVVGAGNETSSFMGVAVYPKITLSESFALGLRAEYFSISKGHLNIIGLDAEGNGSVIEFTLSGNYKVGGLTFIPEVRVDQTSEDSFYKAGEVGPKKLLPSLNLAAVYKF